MMNVETRIPSCAGPTANAAPTDGSVGPVSNQLYA
jgi:hypothetical protein